MKRDNADSAFASSDRLRIGGWTAHNAPAAARLFLPLVGDGPDEWSTWNRVLGCVGLDPEPTLSTSWPEIASLLNSSSLAESVRPSYGLLAPRVGLLLARTADSHLDGPWQLRVADPFLGVSSTSLAEADDPHATQVGMRGLKVEQPDLSYTTFSELLDGWPNRPFPGRAFIPDGSAAVACPPYADSLIVSGPTRWLQQLRELGCELACARPEQPLPLMV